MAALATDRYAAWLSTEIAPMLHERGYRKRAGSFHKRVPDGWAVVNFQKSQFGSRDEVLFTINLAVALDRLMVFDGDDPTKPPPEYRCNMRVRMGNAQDVAQHSWWRVTASTDTRQLAEEIRPLLIDRGLLWIDARCSESSFAAALRGQVKDEVVWPTSIVWPVAAIALGVLGPGTDGRNT
jgi:hypothetical protein